MLLGGSHHHLYHDATFSISHTPCKPLVIVVISGEAEYLKGAKAQEPRSFTIHARDDYIGKAIRGDLSLR